MFFLSSAASLLLRESSSESRLCGRVVSACAADSELFEQRRSLTRESCGTIRPFDCRRFVYTTAKDAEDEPHEYGRLT